MTEDQFEKPARLIKETAEETREDLVDELGGGIETLRGEMCEASMSSLKGWVSA